MNDNDWGLSKETFDILCTLTRLGLVFKCPLEKVIKLRIADGNLESITSETYRRRYK